MLARIPRRRRRSAPFPRRRLSFEALEPRRFLAANPIISEFMASNSGALRDGYGASSDWIEIFNAGDAAIDLAGYKLTDDDDQPSKWQFPSQVLAPGEYLIVFASGLNSIDPTGHLHTNFSLSAEGEYLALVDPQGAIVSEFDAVGGGYPAQAKNLSHGVAFNSTFTQVVSSQTAAAYFVPVNGSLGTGWTAVGFDDSLWQSAAASLGYEAAPASYDPLFETTLPAGTKSAYLRIPFQVSDADAVLGTLRMKYDDGFVAYLNGTAIAWSNAPVNPAFDSAATEFRPIEAAVEDAVFDVSAYSNLLQVGENVLSFHLLDANGSPSEDLLLVPKLTIASGQVALDMPRGDLMLPTPGQPNTQRVASPVIFSRVGGAFADPFQLTLAAGPGEAIHYTTDGSDPSLLSPAYSGPITISATTQIRARAYGPEGQVGRVRTETYSLLANGLSGFTSDLPIVVLENLGTGFPDRLYLDATFSLYDTNSITGRSSLADNPTLTSTIGHHRRGSSTFSQEKPNLRIEFRDDQGYDQDVSLLDLPADADWILHAPHTTDRSLMRNSVMLDLYGQLRDYSVRTRFVEVYFNADGGAIDADDYFGVYVLMEHIEVHEGRVDVDELSPADQSQPDITGGYIIKMDRPDNEEDANWDSAGTPSNSVIVHVDPKRSEMSAAQTAYIRGYIADFEQALWGPNSTDPDLGYAAYIDVESWIDHHLLRVLSRETDALFYSEHLVKPRDGKLTFGPAWDFDRSAGSEGSHVKTAEGWNSTAINMFGYGWWGKLFQDPNFNQAWHDRWQELRATVFSDANLTAVAEAHAAEVTEAQARNSQRWPGVAPDGGDYAELGLTGWDAEVSHLQGWLIARANWITSQLVPLPTISVAAPDNAVTLAHTHPGGQLYYTLDGSDPRASGNGVSSTAILYAGPFTVSPSTPINVRVRPASPNLPWSGMVSNNPIPMVPADVTNLRISELNYNPQDPSAAELLLVPGADNNSFEFVELANIGNRPIDLSDVEFTAGIEFNFSDGDVTTLAPGETVLIVTSQAAFAARYGAGFNIAGEYGGRLDSAGERLTLVDAAGDEIHNFVYDDNNPWPKPADGDGPTLEVVDLLGDHRSATNWRASLAIHGSPGVAALPVVGDYDRSGTVDHADFAAWKSQFSTTVAIPGMGADGNRDGTVDAADYTVYRDNFGATTAIPAGLSISVDLSSGIANNELRRSEVVTDVALLQSSADEPSSKSEAELALSIAPYLSNDLLLLLAQSPEADKSFVSEVAPDADHESIDSWFASFADAGLVDTL
jgi:hypothetical protein